MPVTGFFAPPDAPRYALRRVHVPASLIAGAAPGPAGAHDMVLCDLVIEDAAVADVVRGGSLEATLGPDLDRSMVLPGLIDAHTHLDKGHIAPRISNATGDVPGASAATKQDRNAHWHAEDVRRRMEFGLRCAYAKGVVAIRTHLDSLAPQAGVSFPVFCQMRDAWAGKIDLQASSIGPIDMFMRDEGRALADIVAESGGNLGCNSKFVDLATKEVVPPEFDPAMDRLFALAEERGLDVDLHVDEDRS